MQKVEARRVTSFFRTNRLIFSVIIILILAVITLSAYISFNLHLSENRLKPVPITQATLEQKYGLHVQLVATTAAGGLIDVRLKIIDPQKARMLLGDQANFPALLVGNGVVIRVAEDIASQPIKFEKDAGIYVLYPNAGNLVQPGSAVTITFGELQVEPIPAK